MKRILITLLAVLALPTAVNSEPFFLDCVLNERLVTERDLNTGEYTKRLKQNQSMKLSFALNEYIPSASVSYNGGAFSAYERSEINFNFDEIKLFRQIDEGGTFWLNVYKINRKDGSIHYLDSLLSQSNNLRSDIRHYGTCKKTNKQKTLF